MAESDQNEQSAGGMIGALMEALKATGAIIAAPAMALLEDKHLGAFATQGREELGMALKAFPDSIQALSRADFTREEPQAELNHDQDMDRGR